MIKKTDASRSFAEIALGDRLLPDEMLLELRDALDWKPLERKLETLYAPGVGRPAYPPLALFRILLLERLYDLSDPEASRRVRYDLLFQAFAGLTLEDAPPDDTTIALFRKRLVEGGVHEWAFRFFDRACEKRGIFLKKGTLIDATMVKAAVGEKAKRRNGEPQEPDAAWGKKSEKAPWVFGFKAHVAVDEGSQLIRKVEVTPANEHDSQGFDAVCPKKTKGVCADKAYDSQERREELRERKIAPRILYKGKRGADLPRWQARWNKIWGKRRAPVEAVFASTKRWCGMARIRWLGLEMARLQVWLAALAHNMKRMLALARAKVEARA
jgi:IS5 family transposase